MTASRTSLRRWQKFILALPIQNHTTEFYILVDASTQKNTIYIIVYLASLWLANIRVTFQSLIMIVPYFLAIFKSSIYEVRL